MIHSPFDYPMADHVRRQQRERQGWQQPLYGPRTTPLWCWALMGAGMALVVMLAGCAR